MTRARIAIGAALFVWCSLVVTTQGQLGRTGSATQPKSDPVYAGSASCQSCHAPIYARWSKTRMANVVRDPKVHADAIIPDLSLPDPLVTFTRGDIAVERVRERRAALVAGVLAVAGRGLSVRAEG